MPTHTLSKAQVAKLVRNCFEHLEERFGEEDEETGQSWPYYEPLSKRKEEARLAKNRQETHYWIANRPHETYRRLLIYMMYFWTEYYMLMDRIENGSQDPQDPRKPDALLFLSALYREIKEMGFTLEM